MHAEDGTSHCGDNLAIAALAALLPALVGMFHATQTGTIAVVMLTALVLLPMPGFGVALTLPVCALWVVIAALWNGAGTALHPA